MTGTTTIDGLPALAPGGDYSDRYDPDADFDAWYTDVTAAEVATLVRPGQRLLELGCATGRMTVRFAAAGASVVAVERAEAYLDRARARRLPGVEWVADDIVDRLGFLAAAGARFDHVVLANVLHELPDPAQAVHLAAGVLALGGLLHLTLQNPRSLHRLVAVEMGLLGDPHELSDRGRAFGTRRLLGADELVALATEPGLTLCRQEGLCLKPLPNAAMAALAPEVLDGFARAARHLPEHAAMNYVVVARAH